MSKWNRGEIWLLNLDPVFGSEIGRTRPALIMSRADYNQLADAITVIPVSSGRFIRSFHTTLSDLKEGSYAVIPQIRVATKKRFIKKMGHANLDEMQDIIGKLEFYLDL